MAFSGLVGLLGGLPERARVPQAGEGGIALPPGDALSAPAWVGRASVEITMAMVAGGGLGEVLEVLEQL